MICYGFPRLWVGAYAVEIYAKLCPGYEITVYGKKG